MKSNLNRGKLVPPTSLTAAMMRQKQLQYEISNIEAQLVDQTRKGRVFNDSDVDYADWRASATRALKQFRTESRLLTEWIDVRKHNAERLLREAYEVLKVLEAQVDFEPRETALMGDLEDYFDREETSLVAVGNPGRQGGVAAS